MRSYYTQKRSEGLTARASMWSTVAAMLDLDVDCEEMVVFRMDRPDRTLAEFSYRQAKMLASYWEYYRFAYRLEIKRSILSLRKCRARAAQREKDIAAKRLNRRNARH